MNPLLEQFLSESRELLQECSDTFLKLEQMPESSDLLNRLFRYVHTIKGASGLFDIYPFTELVHAAEDALSRARDGEVVLDADSIDVFFKVMDQLSDWLDELEENELISESAQAQSKQLIRLVREKVLSHTCIESNESELSVCVDSNQIQGSVADLFARPELSSLSNEDRFNLEQILATVDKPFSIVVYRPHESAFFSGDDPANFWRQIPKLHWQSIVPLFETVPAELDEQQRRDALASFDPFLCQLMFVGISSASKDVLESALQYVLDSVSLIPFKLVDESKTKPNHSNLNVEFSEVLKAQLSVLQQLEAMPNPGATLSSTRNVLTGVQSCLAGACEIPLPDENGFSVSQEYLEQLNAIVTKLESGEVAFYTDLNEKSADSTEVSLQLQKQQDDIALIEDSIANSSTASKKAETIKTIKVEQERLEQLVDLAGELIVAKNSMQHLARQVEQEYGIKKLSRDLKAEHAVLNRITESLQSVVMQIRMIPVSTIFQRFPRLVRDLSRKLGKEIELVIEGEDTEADKNIVEQLADPLIHLVRNSIDHGIEMPEQRTAKGKRAAGTIRLVATTVEDTVNIEIHDDGAGIDAQKIKRKAVEKGVISSEQASELNDSDALNLIFEPGFSTCDEVSDLSGRGVGMDVVRTTVASVGGNIQLDSEVGKGSIVRVSLPASITVTRVMMFEMAGQVYGLPVEGVNETIKIKPQQVKSIKGKQAYMLRNQLIPLYQMEKILNVNSNLTGEDLPVINLNINNQVAGFVVDKLLEGVDVIIKPLDGVMARFPMYSGAAVLGDGRVLLVINPKEMSLCH